MSELEILIERSQEGRERRPIAELWEELGLNDSTASCDDKKTPTR